jgi:hypothetical protein
MVYDPVSNSILLYGGSMEENEATDEAWLFDMDSKTWKLLPEGTYEEETPVNFPLVIAGILICQVLSRKSKR